jgi:hypothetical protein
MILVVRPGSRIRILTFYPPRIPDLGVKKAQDPGSATLMRTMENDGLCLNDVRTVLDEQLLHSVPEDVDRLAGESSRVRQVRVHLYITKTFKYRYTILERIK